MTQEQLKITCTSTRCEDGLHSYLQKRSVSRQLNGPCRECGADLVSWDRVHARDLSDVAHTFTAIKTELIRHEQWHRDLDEDAVNHARRKGRVKLREAVTRRLQSAIGRAQHPIEGRQTPFSGNVIFYAQHATATCCRKCAEEWHNIPQGREMTEAELTYCAELVWRYIEERMPNLTEEGEYIPRRKPQRAVTTKEPPPEDSSLARARAAMRAKQQRRIDDADN